MTDDASPENLRKFLESDDPAMVLMGLSIAKGSVVPEELLPIILGLYMWNDDKVVRAAAKSVFTKYAPTELQAKVKEAKVWRYRMLSMRGDKFPEAIRQFLEAFKSQDSFAEIGLEQFIKVRDSHVIPSRMRRGGGQGAVPHLDWEVRWYNAVALGKIGDARAVAPLIEMLLDDNHRVRQGATKALGSIGDARAVKPLAGMLSDDDRGIRWTAAEALGEIDDERALEPLIKALGDEDFIVRRNAAEALGKIGNKLRRGNTTIADIAIEPLIKALEDKYVHKTAAEALKKLGHEFPRQDFQSVWEDIGRK